MEKDKKVTAEYVNNKMESMVSAMFDTMMETEERLKNLETRWSMVATKWLKENIFLIWLVSVTDPLLQY